MKNNKLIKYNLFYSRKRFDPVIFISKNNIKNYQEFVDCLTTIGVRTPGEDYYNRVLSLINAKEIEKSKEEVIAKEEVIVKEEVKIKKSRRRGRRKKE